MRYIVMDVETGGFAGTSLLSAYFGVLDDNFNLIDELELFVRPENKQYIVTAEALGVNKINLIEHDKKAISYREAGTKLFDFIQKNSNDGAIKLLPLGHNVNFDIIRVKTDLISEGSWLKFVSYRIRDTGGVGNYLKDKGLIPSEISGSLSSYAEYFGVDASKAHDAKGDCMMTVQIYKAMLKI